MGILNFFGLGKKEANTPAQKGVGPEDFLSLLEMAVFDPYGFNKQQLEQIWSLDRKYLANFIREKGFQSSAAAAVVTDCFYLIAHSLTSPAFDDLHYQNPLSRISTAYYDNYAQDVTLFSRNYLDSLTNISANLVLANGDTRQRDNTPINLEELDRNINALTKQVEEFFLYPGHGSRKALEASQIKKDCVYGIAQPILKSIANKMLFQTPSRPTDTQQEYRQLYPKTN